MDLVDALALGFSATALAAQGIGSFRRRRRVLVGVGLLTRFPAGADHSEIYVVVDVRVRGGSVGLQAISIVAVDDSSLFVSPADDGIIPDDGGLTEMVNGTGERRILEEGAFVSWVYRVSSPLEGDGVDADTEIVAEVALTSGKVVRSKPITVPPDSVTA